MKKLLCIVLCAICIALQCSCGIGPLDDPRERTAYETAVTSLIEALDRQDGDAVYALFSPAVRVQDQDLKEQIGKLLSVYEGPSSEIGWDGLLAGGASYRGGESAKYADTTFPVRCGDTYYWCYLKLMYENTADEKQIGIVQLDLYTADTYCVFCYDENAKMVERIGLEVHDEITLEEEIRCIRRWPYIYSTATEQLSLEDVKAFFESSNSFSQLKARFGEPNAENIYAYYELPPENGRPRYLEIGAAGDEIYSADIVDDLEYIETIYDNED